MPFKLWLYLCKLAGIPLFVCFIALILLGSDWSAVATRVLFCVLLALGATGACMGVLMVFGRLKMRCPFCGQRGEAWGSKSEGIRMECPTCGLIWTGGALGLQIFRENTPEDAGRNNSGTNRRPAKCGGREK
ncbi:MAG: hypothetical protein GC162_20515 [Planctomycetes bacterium]|nr:hypothetical protein [Planctomycetota bacterium]